MRQSAKYAAIAYSRFSDMPIQQPNNTFQRFSLFKTRNENTR